MKSKLFEKDFIYAPIEEIDLVRSPLYDFAKAKELSNEEADTVLEDLALKLTMLDNSTQVTMSAVPTPETVAFQRYSDKVDASEYETFIFQHPRGEKVKRNFSADIFRFEKRQDHWDAIRRLKSYLADDFLPPVNLKDSTLVELFLNRDDWKEEIGSEKFELWKEDVTAALPKLNYDAVVELALYLAFEAKVNEKYLWREVENVVL